MTPQPGVSDMRPSPKGISGYTLLEILVVIGLLSLFATITVPAIRRLTDQDDGAQAAKAFLDILRSARSVALVRSTPAELWIDPQHQAWWVERESDGITITMARGVLELPAGTEVEQQRPRLNFRFEPTGQAFGDSFHVRTRGGTIFVRIDPWTGEPSAR